MALGDHHPTAGDILRARFFVRKGRQLATPGIHYRVSAQVGAGNSLNDIATTLMNLFPAAAAGLLPPQATIERCEVRDITAHPVAPGSSTAMAGPGSEGQYPLPTQVSGIVTFQTAMAGRAYRGRFYMPFPPNTASDSISLGEPSAAYLTDLSALMDAIAVPLTSGTLPDQASLVPIVYHTSLNTFDDIISHRVNAKWATQRRRGDYGRPND